VLRSIPAISEAGSSEFSIADANTEGDAEIWPTVSVYEQLPAGPDIFTWTSVPESLVELLASHEKDVFNRLEVVAYSEGLGLQPLVSMSSTCPRGPVGYRLTTSKSLPGLEMCIPARSTLISMAIFDLQQVAIGVKLCSCRRRREEVMGKMQDAEAKQDFEFPILPGRVSGQRISL